MDRRAVETALFAMALGACGCNKQEAQSAPTTQLTGAEYDAAHRMAEALCDRETTCSGSSSRDACIEAELTSSVADTQIARCRAPVDGAKVRACIDAIQRSDCAKRVADLGDCKRRMLCPDIAEEGSL